MENDPNRVNLLNLSDYALLEVLKYLNSTDLWHLNKTCRRFRSLITAKKLWRKIDLRDAPIVEEKVTFALKKVHRLTDDVRMCSEGRHSEIIPEDFLKYLSCTNLTVLVLENQKICGNTIKLFDFPESLIELSLRKTYVTHPRVFLDRSNEQMKNLKVFILDQCFWIETIMLVQLSKYKSLEILSLYSCKRINDTDIAYISLAGRFGFNSLRVLDCRFSGLGDQILRTLYNKPHLEEIYFQNYLSTYFLEKSKRELEISLGSSIKKHSYMTDLDDIPMFNKETIETYFGEREFRKKNDLESISDDGTLVYRFTECMKETINPNGFKSALYEAPYADCTCSKTGATSHGFLRNKGPSNKMKSLKKRGIAKTEESIDNELRYATNDSVRRNVHLLVLTKEKGLNIDVDMEATMENRYFEWIHQREPRNDYEIAILEHTDLNGSNTEYDVKFLLLGNLPMQVFSHEDNALEFNAEPPPRGGTSKSTDNSPGKVSVKRKRKSGDNAAEGPCHTPKRKEQGEQRKSREQYVLINALGWPVKHKVGLTSISLRGFKQVTDLTLDCLVHLNLKLLDVTFTKVTEEGLQGFMVINPDCRILHESFCQCKPKMHF